MPTPAGNPTKYILFPSLEEGNALINQINICMGWPNEGTTTWMEQPDWMCEFDLNNGEKTSIGYGVIIKDQILNCLTEQQLAEVFVLPLNINTCAWEVIV